MRFDLKFAFLLMAIVSALAWATFGNNPFAQLAFAVVVGLTIASVAEARDRSPFAWGMIGGAIAAVVLGICIGPLAAIIYLIFHIPAESHIEFFEDGMTFNFVATPISYAVFCGPIGALIGFGCAMFVRLVRFTFNYWRSRAGTNPSAQPPG